MKVDLLVTAGGLSFLSLISGALPLEAMPIVAEKEELVTPESKELEVEISLDRTVENPVAIAASNELKQVDSGDVETAGDRPISTKHEIPGIPQNNPASDKLEIAASIGGFIWNISPKVNLTALYGSVNSPLTRDLGFPATPLGAGLQDYSFLP
ncbi:MAG: hypothetical protein HC849_33380 [Oscillatoriales cyanobacterium RU_3_3]|nr:hypothetical protein [Oscillatoriales cyanobacterium RU_3_3]